MARQALVVEVSAKLSVDRKTAEGCLKMVEMYVNSNHCTIGTSLDDSGEVTLFFAEGCEQNGR